MKFNVLRVSKRKPYGFKLVSESQKDDSFIKDLLENFKNGKLDIAFERFRLVIQNGPWWDKISFRIPNKDNVPPLKTGFKNKDMIRIGHEDMAAANVTIVFEKKM